MKQNDNQAAPIAGIEGGQSTGFQRIAGWSKEVLRLASQSNQGGTENAAPPETGRDEPAMPIWPESTCIWCGEKMPAGGTRKCKESPAVFCSWGRPRALGEYIDRLVDENTKLSAPLIPNAGDDRKEQMRDMNSEETLEYLRNISHEDLDDFYLEPCLYCGSKQVYDRSLPRGDRSNPRPIQCTNKNCADQEGKADKAAVPVDAEGNPLPPSCSLCGQWMFRKEVQQRHNSRSPDPLPEGVSKHRTWSEYKTERIISLEAENASLKSELSGFKESAYATVESLENEVSSLKLKLGELAEINTQLQRLVDEACDAGEKDCDRADAAEAKLSELEQTLAEERGK